ncbi:K(+)/H(+) antiporter NhaP2 [Pseudovibrio axinellae]|uniref:K(+)/H(+) antiporter NhaP2 n=1 Tax=Pseudovibrio axinellae TaxID=989403 RepID=A0A161XCN7_9HYPH|nr:cation:proton antiporter [Pseudovibrio axinellae]KZL09411.1 K(+)/H(+) antiporter NhaP2 [Pseudovibrio axinellae]SEQ65765.1 sodium/proton antiporter, CPA1 family [Pseudovibrio axinellae]
MIYQNLTVIFAVVFLYSVTSRWLEQKPVNGALLFCIIGFLLGNDGLQWFQVKLNNETIKTLAELALAIVLFTDAANTNLKVLKENIDLPRRLLLFGLPLTILLGIGAGLALLPGLPVIEVAILAALLAPTDAALGKAVVTDPAVPPKIRGTLNAESGLNDGICVPIVFTLLPIAENPELISALNKMAAKLLAQQIGLGVIIGIGIALVAGQVIAYSFKSKEQSKTWEQVTIVALAICCFSIAQLAGGSGFIAAFVGGLTFGWLDKPYKKKLLDSAEGVGDTLSLMTWLIFGAAIIGSVLHTFTWEILLYSILSLTLVRILPVYLVLHGEPLKLREKLFIGWFGPRGLASIVFAIVVLDANLPGSSVIASTAVTTIGLSVILHGLTAHTFIKALKS